MSEKSADEWLVLARPFLNFDEFIVSNEDQCVEYLTHAADAGSVKANFILGRYLHLTGEDGNDEGKRRLAVAARGDCATSVFLLCRNYADFTEHEFGMSVDELMSKAYQRLEQAGQQGDAESLYMAGWWRSSGDGCNVDESLSREWIRQAAEMGCVEAMSSLADNILQEDKPDLNEAQLWAERASSAGCGQAKNLLILIHRDKESKAGVPTGDSAVLESERLAREWATQKIFGPLFLLSINLLGGESTEQNKGLELLQYASQQGSTSCMNLLASRFFRGDLVQQDYRCAASLYQQSAELNDTDAAHELAKMYEQGLGVERSPELADKYFDMAGVAKCKTIGNDRSDLNEQKKEDLIENMLDLVENGRIREVQKWIDRFAWLLLDPVWAEFGDGEFIWREKSNDCGAGKLLQRYLG